MHIDGIVHHAFVEAVFGDECAAALHKVGGIGLSGEIALRIFGDAHIEAVEVNIGAHLRHQTHTFGIVNIDVAE